MNRKVVVWLFSVFVFLILWQKRVLHPYIVALGILVVLGMLLRYFPTIRTQFANLGK